MGYIIPNWSENKYKKFMADGRGKNEGKSYKPWITVSEGPKGGRASRNKGWKTRRIHHLLSDNETDVFYILEWADNVVDIREQFPILDYEHAMSIAKDCGIEYPLGKDGFPYILTTDFLITLNINGKRVNIARTVKPFEQLDKSRILELFEIERRYWRDRNIDWGIITEREINKTFCRNVELLHPAYRLQLRGMLVKDIELLSSMLLSRLSEKTSLREVCSEFDFEHNLEIGTALSIIKHLLAHKKIGVNMFESFDTSMLLNNIKIASMLHIRERKMHG